MKFTRISLVAYLITIIFFNPVAPAYSQQKNMQFKYLTPDDGLSSSIVYSIIQDHMGFMWIGTADGLNRYDGFKFDIFRHNPNDSTSLADNVINSLFEDHNKNLIIGTEEGLSIYDRELERFKNLYLDRSSPFFGSNFTISSVSEDSYGNLWISTEQGLVYFDRKNNKIVKYVHDPDNPNSISSNTVEHLFIDRSGSMWVTTRNGLNIFNPLTSVFTHFKKAVNSNLDLSTEVFDDIAEDDDGYIWVGGQSGVYRIEKSVNIEMSKIYLFQNDINDNSSLSINQISAITEDTKGNIWIGTENGGLNLFNKEKQNFIRYRRDDYDMESLNNESIETIYEDKSGNLWFGTYNGGLNIRRRNSDAIIHYQAIPGAPLSLSNNSVTCFLQDNMRNIWIGTDGGGLNLFNVLTDRFTRFNTQNSAIGSNAILCLVEDGNDNLWMGTWAGGLVSYNLKSGRIEPLNITNSSIPDNNIFTIAKGDDNNLWLGTFEHGLVNFRIKEKKFVSYTPENSGISNQLVVKLANFSKGRLLIGTTYGLQLFSPLDGKFISFGSVEKDSNTLSNPRVTDILVDSDTIVWVGTPHGLNRFNPLNGTFIRYYERDGLPNNFIKGLAKDNSGNLWVTTNNGVCRFDYKNRRFKNFTKTDGIQSNEFNQRSILKLNDGAILMGGVKGFNLVYQDKITENQIIPNILITDLKLFGKSLKPGNVNSPLSKDVSETKSITLSSGQTYLTFSFAAMDFSAPSNNLYAYKMENFDAEWIYPGNKGEVTYTNLNPGKYVFRVRGTNCDGLWNETGTSIEITVLPPWWFTWWFKILFCFTVLLLFTVFYYSRINRLKKQKEFLEKTVREKTSELNELNVSKDKFFSIIAHDLVQPFNTIIGFSDILKDEIYSGDREKVIEYAKNINISAVQTHRLLENLLEWANSQRGRVAFNPVIINLKEVYEEEFRTLNEIAIAKGIGLKCYFSEDVLINADRNMIKTVLRNLVSNALKFTGKGGIIELRSVRNYDNTEISISDTGIGMSSQTLEKLFRLDANLSTSGTENEKGTGLGLFLCKEFIEKHRGKIWAESAPGKGSKFIFTIPSF